MSTKLHDFAHQAILGAGLTPRTITASTNGATARSAAMRPFIFSTR